MHVDDFGCVPYDGFVSAGRRLKTDSRPGLELLLASLGRQNIESAVHFGSGVCNVTRIPVAAGAQPAAIGLFGLRNLTFRDPSVHGAYLTLGNTIEQMRGILVKEGSEEIAVQRVLIRSSGH